jgi:hypothetical protein
MWGQKKDIKCYYMRGEATHNHHPFSSKYVLFILKSKVKANIKPAYFTGRTNPNKVAYSPFPFIFVCIKKLTE